MSARCLSNLIAWSGFGVAPLDGIVMNVLVVEISLQLGAIVLVVCHFPFFLLIFPFPTLYAAA